MALFSERYNYTKPSEVLLRECFPKEIANGVCTCFDKLKNWMDCNPYINLKYEELEEYLWIFFFESKTK